MQWEVGTIGHWRQTESLRVRERVRERARGRIDGHRMCPHLARVSNARPRKRSSLAESRTECDHFVELRLRVFNSMSTKVCSRPNNRAKAQLTGPGPRGRCFTPVRKRTLLSTRPGTRANVKTMITNVDVRRPFFSHGATRRSRRHLPTRPHERPRTSSVSAN